MRGADLVVAVGADQQEVRGPGVGGELLEQVEAGRVGPLEIVEEEHQGCSFWAHAATKRWSVARSRLWASAGGSSGTGGCGPRSSAELGEHVGEQPAVRPRASRRRCLQRSTCSSLAPRISWKSARNVTGSSCAKGPRPCCGPLLLRPLAWHSGVMLLPELPIAFGLVSITAASALAARRLHVPFSIVLVVVGLALGFAPFMPRVELRPDLVLSLLLPPLLYSAGVGMSWRGFRPSCAPSCNWRWVAWCSPPRWWPGC